MTNSNSTQQLLQQQQYSNTLHSSSRQVYTNTYSYVVQQRTNSIHFIIYQVQVLCCETAHGAYVTKRETATVRIHERGSSSGSSTMYAHTHKSDFSTAQTTPQSSSYTFFHWNNQRKEMSRKKKKKEKMHILESIHGQHVEGITTYHVPVRLLRFLHENIIRLLCIYT